MRLNRLFVVGLLSLAALLPAPASAAKAKEKVKKCASGETSVHGKCVKACPTEDNFGDPDSCECPAGYGKILTGNGGGLCSRLRCPTNAEMPADRDCDCPPSYEKHKIARGKARCDVRQARAK